MLTKRLSMSQSINLNEYIILSIEDVEKIKISAGDLFYFAPISNKYIRYLKAGEYVLPSFVQKLRENGIKSVYFRPYSPGLQIAKITDLWNKLKIANENENLSEEEVAKNKIIEEYYNSIIYGSESVSLVEYVSAYISIFCEIQLKQIDDFAEKNFVLLKRSFLLASLSIPGILALGYVDFKFLKKVFNAILLMDYKLTQTDYTIHLQHFFEHDSIKSGDGHLYLREKAANELYKIEKHLEIDTLEFDNECLKELREIHHESANGLGFPHGISKREVPDWIALIIVMDKLLHWEDREYQTGDGTGLLTSIVEKKWTDEFDDSWGFSKIQHLFFRHWRIPNAKSKKVG